MIQTITLIGAGNVAQHLAIAFAQKNLRIEAVFSRQMTKAQHLAQQLTSTTPQDHLDFSQSESDFFLLAINDDAIEEVCKQILLPPSALVAHCAGAKSINVLDALPNPKGVFYPLQTFSQGKTIDFEEVPFCIEASTTSHEEALVQLAQLLSERVYRVNSTQRQSLHVAAVFANNFTNYLLSISEELLQEAQLPFDLLKPLLYETIEKALQLSPTKAQTGPARRSDQQTISKHLDLLSKHPSYQALYQQLSVLIGERYG